MTMTPVRHRPFQSGSERRRGIWNRLEPEPSSAQAFGGFARGATAGKGVQDQVACSGQELYEELGELNGEAGRVGLDFFIRTAREVVAVGVVVPQGQEVGGNGAALFGELVGDFVAGGPLLRPVSALEQPFHVFGILGEDLPVIRLRLRGFGEPPQRFDGVLDPNPAHGDPFRRRGKLGGIVPEEFLRQMEAVFAHEPDQDLEVTECADWMPRAPTAADIDDEASIGLQDAPEFGCEPQEPVHVFVLVHVAVVFFEVQGVRWRREDQVDRFVG